ncbi:3'(2'),5'-bisphosphate nucleotidase CysQ [Congregibacter litoralis]|uniref:3'(2'),5'-bisphosphate nucleotidase CysQ n=1 Tax=Congregibacter litoralis TaxID=393662 RepID=UPI00006B2F24|nr:3'(2'),5'-bisphosphate nucleotidase CysQ [Congregibacter litoralis]
MTRTDILALLDLCHQASERIVQFYNDEASASLFSSKEDRTPLTQADLTSHQILSSGLAALNPELPLLSEECSSSEIAGRHQWNSFWMVDPLDGTREFLERTGEFTINIALIEEQRPTVGLIYEPLKHKASLGIVGAGAWELRWEEGSWRSTAITTRRLPARELVLLASKRHRNPQLDDCIAYLESSHDIARQNSGSALKFCDLAAGQGDCYPRFSPCSEWDVAAGDALVSAAGGAVYGLNGAPLRYNARDTLLSPHFVAVGDSSAALWAGLLESVQ